MRDQRARRGQVGNTLDKDQDITSIEKLSRWFKKQLAPKPEYRFRNDRGYQWSYSQTVKLPNFWIIQGPTVEQTLEQEYKDIVGENDV